jgi:outer membrane protein TolC
MFEKNARTGLRRARFGVSLAARVAAGAVVTAWLSGCGAPAASSHDALTADLDRSALEAHPADARSEAEDARVLQAPRLARGPYVRAVVRRNPSIDAAREGWRAALAHARVAGAPDDPMVTLQVAPLSIASSNVRLGVEAMISQRVPWPGKLGFEQAAAEAEARAAKSDLKATQRDLALSASLLYDDYFVAVRSLEINAQHVALMRDLKAAALAALESGRGSTQDPLEAEAELTHLEHDTLMLESQRDVTRAQMNELLHREPTSALPPPEDDLARPSTPELPDAQGVRRLADEAAARRPEIEASRQRAQAEAARARRAKRESYPDLTVSSSYSTMWDMPEHRWMIGLGFNLPVLLGRREGAVDEANAARARFESQARGGADKARTEVVIAVTRLTEAHHVLELFERRLIPIARDQVDAARAGFVASRNDFRTVIAAERNLRGVDLDHQIAIANFDRRRAELDRALGRVPGIDDAATATATGRTR